MNKKEKYESQRNFCSEFMRCFVDLYCDSMEKLNKELSKVIEKDLKEKEKRSKVCKDSSLLNYGYHLLKTK